MTVQTDPEATETKYLLRLADLTRGGAKRVLEIGCGDGRLTWRYAKMARHVLGVDLHADDLRVAFLDRPADLSAHVEFALADATHLPARNAAFDLAIFAWSF